jgi:hypothetical protein
VDDWTPSAFTPFARRFTDERALNLRETQQLYDRVRARHQAFRADQKFADVKRRIWAYLDRYTPMSEFYMPDFNKLIENFLDAEQAIFAFPENLDIRKLALKEQADLTRFLYAKTHALDNEARILDLLVDAITRVLGAYAKELPTVSLLDEPLFSLPLANALPDLGESITRIYNTLADDKYVDSGLFARIGTQLYNNIAEASGNNPAAPKRPWKHAHENPLPPDELVRVYLGGTPFTKLFALRVPLAFDEETRFSHAHLVGGSGAGKTQMLQHLILHDLKSEDAPALVIVDGQTDLIRKISRLALFDPEHGRLRDRLTLITPRDIQYPPALNIFDVNRERLSEYDEATKEQITAGVIQTFEYLFDGLVGADLTAKQGVFFKFLARLMLSLPESSLGRNATILDFIEIMDDVKPYQDAIDRLPVIQRTFFERDFKTKTFAGTKEQVRYRLNAILENPTFARLFSSPTTKVDLFHALNNQGIVLVDTAKDFLKGSSAHFGRIFISLVLQAILERAAIPEYERKPAFLIVDEAAAYFDSNMDDLLTEARKYKLGCVFAHQFLGQASQELRASLAANTAIKMAAGVSMQDARAMAPDMRTTPEFILGQPRLHFAAYIRGATASAVSMAVPVGELEAERRMDDASFASFQQANRERVSLGPQPQAQRQPSPVPEPAPRLPQPVESTADDGTKASKEW